MQVKYFFMVLAVSLLFGGCANKTERARTEFKGVVSALKAAEEADRMAACEAEYKKIADNFVGGLKKAKAPAGQAITIKVTALPEHCRDDADAIATYINQKIWEMVRTTK